MQPSAMSDIVVTREEVGYRGGAGGVDIFVPSRAIQLAGKPKLLSKFWYALLAFMVFYGALFLYIQSREGVDQALGALVLLLMLAPLIMLGGGRRIGSALGRGVRTAGQIAQYTQLPDAGVDEGRTIHRPNQRLTLGQTNNRQVYEDGAMSRRNTPLRLDKSLRLEVRDDDGEDDGVFDTAGFWLVDPNSHEEQLLLEKIARDERDKVTTAIREALHSLT